MSTKWKTVKKKKKFRKAGDFNSNPLRTKNPQGGSGGGQGKQGKKKKKNPNPKQHSQFVKNLGPVPFGASGAPKLMKKMGYDVKKGPKKVNKKNNANDDRALSGQNEGNWVDPNSFHQMNDSGYHYHEEVPKNLIPQTLSDKIRKNREKKGYSRKDFAAMINEDISVVAAYEMAKCESKVHILKKMSRVLKVPLGKKAGKKLKDEQKQKFYDRS